MLKPNQLSVNDPSGTNAYANVKNETSSGAGDGTNIEAQVSNNLWYALLAVLDHAGVTPSGSVEASDGSPVLLSGTNDLLDSIVALISSIIDTDVNLGGTDAVVPSSPAVKAYVDASDTAGFTPAAYTGGESVTLPNGMIMKTGIVSSAGVTGTVTFGTAFPNAIVSVTVTPDNSGNTTVSYNTESVTGFDWEVGGAGNGVGWMAIGY